MATENIIQRGYGPSRALMFTGNPEDFELWSVKFKGFLRIHKLHIVLETVVGKTSVPAHPAFMVEVTTKLKP